MIWQRKEEKGNGNGKEKGRKKKKEKGNYKEMKHKVKYD